LRSRHIESSSQRGTGIDRSDFKKVEFQKTVAG
jgi:hypothetical protein